MKKPFVRLTALALSLALLLTSCGGGASATSMHLRKTEGTVGVSDGEGKDITAKDNLGLYSGYQVGTQAESYAWIDLDREKLTKLDADSEIEIGKEGKKLEINVKSGSLFFNVTEPLADDETMHIATSTMMVGIRGTCGWVGENTAALLEGTVSVTAGEQEVTINAGEMAVLKEDGKLEVKPFTAASVPAFVREEVAEDEELAANIQDTTGMDLTEADPADAFADAFAKFDKEKEVVYTELVDFEGDGDPELLVIAKGDTENGQYSSAFSIWAYQNSPEGTRRIPFVGKSQSSTSVNTGGTQFLANDLSLAEYDGKMFLKSYYAIIDPSIPSAGEIKRETTNYFSFYFDEDGERQIYQDMAKCDTRSDGQRSYWAIHAGVGGGSKPCPAEEAEAILEKYTDVHDLITLVGNELVVTG